MTITADVKTKFHADSRLWETLEAVVFVLPSSHTITVPPGFLTDGASVPWIFRGVFPRVDRYFAAAVVHDWLYRTGGRVDWQPQALGQYACDRAFYLGILACGVGRVTACLMYRAVRWFGWSSFCGLDR